MTTGQLVMPLTVPGSYWVRVIDHGIIPDGTRFLVVRPWHGDWLLAWRDGVRPQPEKRLGALLRRGQVERVNCDQR